MLLIILFDILIIKFYIVFNIFILNIILFLYYIIN